MSTHALYSDYEITQLKTDLQHQRHTHEGDHVACPAYQSDLIWQKNDNQLVPIATGRRASSLQLDVAPDLSIIYQLVQQWAKANATT